MTRSDTAPDADLVRAHLHGDARAFEILVSRHRDRVYRLCLRMVGNPDDALDASQDAFVHALRNLARFRGDAAFTTWLHRITVNACYDLLRRRQRQPVLHAVAENEGREPEPGPPVIDHADDVAGTIDAAAALVSVPEEFRAALVLADVEDLPYEEIGRILEIPVGTVKSRVHRGRVALARAMAVGEPTGGLPASKEER